MIQKYPKTKERKKKEKIKESYEIEEKREENRIFKDNRK